MSAVLLSQAIARIDADAVFEGTGGERMRAAGIRVRTDTRGWGSMGLLEALSRVPKLYTNMWLTALHLARARYDLVVVVDFGAYHLRLIKSLRMLGYKKPVLYFFPPGAWLDNPKTANAVAAMSVPLVAFEHQRDFYRRLGLPVHYFGHPLTSAYDLRPPRATPQAGAGTVALLPGSREAELRYHLPVLLDAFAKLRASRPHLRGVIGAADDAAESRIRSALTQRKLEDLAIVRSARGAFEDADAAWIASGTAVLEAALCGVPSVALYILSAAQARIARRVYRGEYITIPNLILKKAVIPELLQENATAENLASAMDGVLSHPAGQYAELQQLRSALGPSGALQACAAFAADLARVS